METVLLDEASERGGDGKHMSDGSGSESENGTKEEGMKGSDPKEIHGREH